MLNNNKSYKIIITALSAAMICVATMVIHIPTGATGGYANLGDGILLTFAFLFGPSHAFAAAAIGSMLADVLSGYMLYAPGTLVIKGVTALIAALLSARCHQSSISASMCLLIRFMAGLVAELFMVAGYFAYEAMLLGYGQAALLSVPANLAQGAVGIVVSLALSYYLLRSPEIERFVAEFWHSN